jgi:hypothetical protein
MPTEVTERTEIRLSIEILCATVKRVGSKAGSAVKLSIGVDGRIVVGLESSRSELAVEGSIRS